METTSIRQQLLDNIRQKEEAIATVDEMRQARLELASANALRFGVD
jgi:hypothetical protein